MGVELLVDHREPTALKTRLVELLSDEECAKHAIAVEYCNLEAGDVALRHDGKLLLLLERKELNDLCASLKDGRAAEQKQKMAAIVTEDPNVALGLIVEGEHTRHERAKAIQTVTCTSRLRDGYFVFHTIDTADTAGLVARLATLYARGKMQPFDAETNRRYLLTARASHRAAGISRHDSWWVLALTQVAGVGAAAAQAIAERYPSARALVQAYAEAAKPEELLAGLLPRGGKRRLGPKLSQRVYDCVTGSSGSTGPAAASRLKRPNEQPGKPHARRKFSRAQPPLDECQFIDE